MFAALLPLLLPAIVPAVIGGVGQIINKLTGVKGAEPKNVDEAIRLMEADIKRLQVIAQLDTPSGNISKWVADLRASFRYLLAGFFVFATAIVLIASVYTQVSDPLVDNLLQIDGSIFSFFFGDRLYFHYQKKGK
jgi:hypothetical protein